MQRICVLLATVFCAVPSAAFAGASAAGDGSLDVSGGSSTTGASGSVSLSGKGVVFGAVASGAITVFSYKPDPDNAVPTVSGAKMALASAATSVVYTGNNMRFLFPGGRYKIEIDGTGISISAVGNGSVSAVGAGTLTADTVTLALGRAPALASWGTAATGSSGGK